MGNLPKDKGKVELNILPMLSAAVNKRSAALEEKHGVSTVPEMAIKQTLFVELFDRGESEVLRSSRRYRKHHEKFDGRGGVQGPMGITLLSESI